jgi:DNA-binding NtrC family response regulator
MSKLAPAVIVLERRPCWESELKRRLSPEGILVRPCRALSDLLHMVRQMPGSAAVIDLGTEPSSGLSMLQNLVATRLPVSPVVIAAESDRDIEWAARELGAVGFFSESVSGDELAGICRRLLSPDAARRSENSSPTR